MKRDMELVKNILIFYEDQDWPFNDEVIIEGYDENTIQFHLELLVEAELLYCYVPPLKHPDLIKDKLGAQLTWNRPPIAKPTRMTWEGYEFIANAKNDTIWSQVMKVAGGFSVSVISQCLTAMAIFYAQTHGVIPR